VEDSYPQPYLSKLTSKIFIDFDFYEKWTFRLTAFFLVLVIVYTDGR
jgi:hypothetical protein